MKILVVEDEAEISSFLRTILEREGYSVSVCEALKQVIDGKEAQQHDMMILDLMLKDGHGSELITQIRKEGSNLPILVLSAVGQIGSKIEMINLGADDYMTKPFDSQELVARLKALHRRLLQETIQDEYELADIAFYRKQHRLVREGKEIPLTNRESDLFELLLMNRGKTVSFEDILRKIWKSRAGYHSNVVQATVRRLRKKVDHGFRYPLIYNVHGVGYRLEVQEF